MSRRHARTLIALLAAAALALTTTIPAVAATRSSAPNDAYWYDQGNGFLSAQGGSVLKVGSTYYWVGMEFANDGDYAFGAVNLYKSTDLMNWTWVKAIFTPQPSGDLAVGDWVGRPDLVYNPSTGKYIIVMEIDGTGSGIGPGNKIGFASSSTVEGTYTYHGSTAVNGSTMGDHSVFVNGTSAYLVYAGDNPGSTQLSDRNVTLNIAPLASNWLSVLPAIYTEANTSREAPFIMKRGTKFHWFASGKDWWDSTATSHRVSSSLTSWPAWSTLATSPASYDSFNTQFDFIIPITGSAGTSYIYAGDRYTSFQGGSNPAPTGSGRNAWMPLTFSGDTPTLHGFSDLTISLTTGQLGGNAVANARFENEGVTQSPSYWLEWGTADAMFTQTGGVTGNRLTFWKATAYESYAYQYFTGLPSGTYTYSVRMLSSGTHDSALLVGKPSGGAEVNTNLNTLANNWVTRSVSFTVTNGNAEIGLYVDGTPGSWLSIDNVSLTRN